MIVIHLFSGGKIKFRTINGSNWQYSTDTDVMKQYLPLPALQH